MISTRSTLVLASLAIVAGDARAEDPEPSITAQSAPSPDTAISIQLATLDTTGVALQGERALGRAQLSLAVAAGLRSAAMGDYDSTTVGLGVELRRWFREDAIEGFFVGARSDYAYTRVKNEAEGYRIGSLSTLSLGVTGGYRFVLFDHVELTPSLGIAMIAEAGMNGRSPLTARGAGVVGLTAGAIF